MASSRNWNRIERLVAPMDFSMPISRARCVTDTNMMLARPMPPMANVSVPTKPSRICSAVPMESTMRRNSLKTMPAAPIRRGRWGSDRRPHDVGSDRCAVHACIFCYRVGTRQQPRAIQYTVRGIPPEVDSALRGTAAQRQQSLNQFIVDELTMATGGHRRRADFSDLVGRWTADPAFDEILAAQRQIDPDKWK